MVVQLLNVEDVSFNDLKKGKKIQSLGSRPYSVVINEKSQRCAAGIPSEVPTNDS